MLWVKLHADKPWMVFQFQDLHTFPTIVLSDEAEAVHGWNWDVRWIHFVAVAVAFVDYQFFGSNLGTCWRWVDTANKFGRVRRLMGSVWWNVSNSRMSVDTIRTKTIEGTEFTPFTTLVGNAFLLSRDALCHSDLRGRFQAWRWSLGQVILHPIQLIRRLEYLHTFRANSMTAICIPRHIPRYGFLLSLAHFAHPFYAPVAKITWQNETIYFVHCYYIS